MPKTQLQERMIPTIEPNYLIKNEEIVDLKKSSRFWDEVLNRTTQTLVDKDFVKMIEWQDRPDVFMKEVLGFEPWDCPGAASQLDVCLAIRDNERVSVRSGNGVGKTAIAAQIAMWFLTCFVPSIVVTTAPTSRQVDKQLWGEIRKYYKNSKVPIGGELLMSELRIDEGWYAIGFATDEPERFQGFHSPHILIICDEASGINDNIFEAIEGLMTSANVRLLLIGNPTNPVSYFGRTHLHPRESKHWVKLHINCYNSPNVRAGKTIVPSLCRYDWPKKRLEAWGKYNPFYQVRVLGNFPEMGEDNLIPYFMVHESLERSIPPAGRKILSVDVARFGNDKSIIARLWGEQFRILKKLYKQDGTTLANAVVEQIKKPENIDVEEIRIDVIGWGASCFDELKRKKREGNDTEKEILKNIKIIPVNVSERCRSSKARKDYYNIRAEAGFTLRGMFEEGMIDIDDEELGVQAANLKYKFSQGRYVLEEKTDYKKRLSGDSPDELDALLIAKCIVKGGSPTIH